jgi:hypothetical protein
MPIKQSQHNGIWSNLIYVIIKHCNVSLGFNMFQLSFIAPSKSINLIIELLMAWLVDVSITQNMATTCFNPLKHGHYTWFTKM